MPDYTTPPPTQIHPDSQEAFERVKAADLAILCGRNNSGKSFLLRALMRHHGQKASYLGPARYSNFNTLAPYGPRLNRREEKWRSVFNHFHNATQNVDNSPLNVQQAIAELSDGQRSVLFRLVGDLLGAGAKIEQTVPGNSMSQKYIDVDGFNLSFTSSGFRLVATLLTSLLDQDYTHFLIDEPELGLSPEIQGVFADWLLDPAKRAEYLTHVQGVVLATHSPVFLDRKNVQNNFLVDRIGTQITIRSLATVQDLNALQFRLLGNRFETLFLPSAILLVEGKTDHAFLSRLISQRRPNSTVSIIHASGDGRMREIVAIARQMLGDITRSPYAQRVFAVLDSRHGHGLSDHLIEMGVPRDNVVIWEANGIEYLYPRSILEARFGAYDALVIAGDRVNIGAHAITKQELADLVVNSLRGDEALPEELLAKLIRPLEALLY